MVINKLLPCQTLQELINHLPSPFRLFQMALFLTENTPKAESSSHQLSFPITAWHTQASYGGFIAKRDPGEVCSPFLMCV